MWTTRSRAAEFFAFGFVLSLLLAGIGIWLGLLLWPSRNADLPGLSQLNAVTTAREAENVALQARIASLQGALGGNVCRLDPGQIAPLGTVNRQSQVQPSAVPATPGKQAFKGSLAQLLDQATVMIIAFRGKDLMEGSGFFISQDQIVTNRHVVAGAAPGKIFVLNAGMPRPLPAELLASTASSAIGAPDFAVLRVAAQPNVQPLALTTSVEQLQAVVAAGYPGIELMNDKDFIDMLHGNGATAPSVILTDGRISAIQTAETGVKILPHTAEISEGNSGGPLVDQCGRVVGIDTFGVAESEQTAHLNYALEASVLAQFLHGRQIGVAVTQTPCTAALVESAPPGPPPAGG